MPIWVYVDWLREVGWEAHEEEFILGIQADYSGSSSWKEGADTNYGDGMEDSPEYWYDIDYGNPIYDEDGNTTTINPYNYAI